MTYDNTTVMLLQYQSVSDLPTVKPNVTPESCNNTAHIRAVNCIIIIIMKMNIVQKYTDTN